MSLPRWRRWKPAEGVDQTPPFPFWQARLVGSKEEPSREDEEGGKDGKGVAEDVAEE